MNFQGDDKLNKYTEILLLEKLKKKKRKGRKEKITENTNKKVRTTRI